MQYKFLLLLSILLHILHQYSLFVLQVYYEGIFNEEGRLQPLLLLITINSFFNMYFYLQTSELLSGKAFNIMSEILHFDVGNVSQQYFFPCKHASPRCYNQTIVIPVFLQIYQNKAKISPASSYYSSFHVGRPKQGRCMQRPYKALVMGMQFINLKSAVTRLPAGTDGRSSRQF